jgi:hypothetical protein
LFIYHSPSDANKPDARVELEIEASVWNPVKIELCLPARNDAFAGGRALTPDQRLC